MDKKIALLSNITANTLTRYLGKGYQIYIPDGYNTWVTEVFDKNARLNREAWDAVFILLDGTGFTAQQELAQLDAQLSIWEEAVRAFSAQNPYTPVFVSTLDMKASSIRTLAEEDAAQAMQCKWREQVEALVKTQRNVYLWDLAAQIAETGRKNFYSAKMWYMANMPYSLAGLQQIAGQMEGLLQAAFVPRKKLIVLDLDNTLWGGVVGEDGMDGIQLSRHKEGARYYDFQRCLAEMKRRGVLLAVCSKNNRDEAMQVLEKHPDMVLRPEDFVALQINWEDKAGNIARMARELDLTQGSIVFIDDNPVEREQVRQFCPDVLVPEFPADTAALPDFAGDLYERYFRLLTLAQEDKEKTAMYHAREKRRAAQRKSASLGEYIKRLEMEADIHMMQPDEIARAAQLCSKTNQFNLTTKRYTEKELAQLQFEPGTAIFTVHVKDRFGDEGLVGVVIVKENADELCFDTFLMSCRVMGRGLETVIMNELMNYYKGKSTRAAAQYIKTAKNAPVETFYEKQGFALLGQDAQGKRYRYELEGFVYRPPEMYKRVSFNVQ